ncbi:MAG TPA: precorrin-6A reductase [Euryarchaeota archaeon]|nr:precorrin-6A reductase [Euryarchaeota archaeon]
MDNNPAGIQSWKKMIMLLGGTTEGREIAALLEERDYPFFITVTTTFGESLLEGGDILRRKLNKDNMLRVIKDREVKLIIDATHPFAVEASRNAIYAAKMTGVEYLRYERESFLPENAICVSDIKEAGELSVCFSNIFYTAGSKGLSEFLSALGQENRVVVRIIPTPEVIAEVEALGIARENIVAMKGPFSRALNRALFSEFGADAVISKESGEKGGLREKACACSDLDIPLIIIRRPGMEYPRAVNSYSELMKIIEEIL